MNFVAVTVVLLLVAASIIAGLLIAYLIKDEKPDQRPPLKESVLFFLLLTASLYVAYSFLDREELIFGMGILSGGFAVLLIAIYHVSFVPEYSNDGRMLYAMLFWATCWLLSIFLLFALWWAGDHLELDSVTIKLDSPAILQIVNNTAQIVGIVIAAVMIVVTNMLNAGQARAASQMQIYQTLEVESIHLFQFEVKHPELVALLWRPEEKISDKYKKLSTEARDYLVHQYICMMLNLFEMAVRFRRDGIMPSDVFGSWVIWMWQLCASSVFQGHWRNSQLPINYIPDLTQLMNAGVNIACKKPKDIDGIRDFFIVVSEQFDCAVVMNWLKRAVKHQTLRERSLFAREREKSIRRKRARKSA